MAQTLQRVWVLTGKSESGDDCGPTAYLHKPTDQEISDWCHARDGVGTGSAAKDGPGYDGSWVHMNLHECVPIE